MAYYLLVFPFSMETALLDKIDWVVTGGYSVLVFGPM